MWEPGEMKADMRHFKELTMGSVLIMGRKTLDSIGVALPGRQTIVLTRGKIDHIPDIKVVGSLDEAYEVAGSQKEVFVSGGGEIYEQAMPGVDRIYATEVDAIIPNADTYFPTLGTGWQKTDEEFHPADENNKYPLRFVTYERQR